MIKTKIFTTFGTGDNYTCADDQCNKFIANNPKIKPIDFKFQGNVSGYADGGINGNEYYEAILMIYKESVDE